MKKIGWKKVIVLLVAFFVVFQIAGSLFFYNLAIKRGPKDFLTGNADLKVSAETMDVFLNGDWLVWVDKQEFKEMHMTSRDGVDLMGYFLAAKQPTDKLVILTHGYLGHAKQMGLYGQYYYEELGYNIFLPNARGHGKSGGDYYGFGWPDRLDVMDWTKLLAEEMDPDTQVLYHGLSMGAATVLMASGESLPKQVKAIIADSPYQSVYQLFAYQLNRMFHLPAFPLLDNMSLLTSARAGYSLKEADALSAVQRATVPILYIHGNADTFVPTEMTKELYEKTKSDTELFLVDDANHGEAFVMDQEAYKRKVDEFLEKHWSTSNLSIDLSR
ncbi:alpha/beta hydrolase [Sporosarcina sp. P12(2017)]|uniref:alpha/beta hydrolase n=1 Tax=unclassified Sporosarcina TaxID=2647733 RepID=UPI000C16F4E6|nr:MULTISPECIES: alpha/beta hydrolase [unclassified Sporosarcina]PIC57296.1 alpha/beta hydrolase [Sporosarcina sp. P10]PIC60678.1 alpha/beta hydrolase [Sporosarcina sp. P12(2017)]